MSADNYIIIRKDFITNQFVPVMGFDSDNYKPEIQKRHKRYDTLDEALEYAHGQYTEYGVSIHPECNVAHFRVIEPLAVIASILAKHYTSATRSFQCICGEEIDSNDPRGSIASHQSQQVVLGLGA